MADGKNALFVAGSWGSIEAFCTRISRGMTIISSEDSARYNRTLYVRQTTSGSFGVNLVFRSHAEYQSFMQRLQEYVRLAADPDSGVPPMLVSIPARKFLRTGIPTTPIPFGDRVGAVTYKATIGFEGTTDPLAPIDVRVTQPASGITEENRFFYPTEVGGSLEDSLYAPYKPGFYDVTSGGSPKGTF